MNNDQEMNMPMWQLLEEETLPHGMKTGLATPASNDDLGSSQVAQKTHIATQNHYENFWWSQDEPKRLLEEQNHQVDLIALFDVGGDFVSAHTGTSPDRRNKHRVGKQFTWWHLGNGKFVSVAQDQNTKEFYEDLKSQGYTEGTIRVRGELYHDPRGGTEGEGTWEIRPCDKALEQVEYEIRQVDNFRNNVRLTGGHLID